MGVRPVHRAAVSDAGLGLSMSEDRPDRIEEIPSCRPVGVPEHRAGPGSGPTPGGPRRWTRTGPSQASGRLTWTYGPPRKIAAEWTDSEGAPN